MFLLESFQTKLFIVFLLISSIQVKAAPPNPCVDLHGYACSSTTSDDSGITHKIGYTKYLYEKAISEWTKIHRSEFANKFTNDRPKRIQLLDALSISSFNTCRYYFADNCVDLVIQSITKILRNRIWEPGYRDLPSNDKNLYDAILAIKYSDWIKPIQTDFLNFLISKIDRQKDVIMLNGSILPNIQQLLIGVVRDLKIDPSVVEKIATRINAIKIVPDLIPNQNDKDFENQIYEKLVSINAGYNSDKNTIVITNGFLATTSSEYALVRVLGHELAHSIDPCSIGNKIGTMSDSIINYSTKSEINEALALTENPFSNILICLQQKNSIGATSTSGSAGWGNIRFQLSKAMNPDIKMNYFCNENHQLKEAFPDLLASEVLARYIATFRRSTSPLQKLAGIANSLRFSCGLSEEEREKGQEYRDIHSMNALRANRLLLSNPRIYKDMSCADNALSIAPDCLSSIH